mmetsp:Transcript_32445/g.70053  ORF Transcript_32445/g.70053 Transcript_32445/m.70053 type:complete len:87 (+) Transcript_32445:429-689(+)
MGGDDGACHLNFVRGGLLDGGDGGPCSRSGSHRHHGQSSCPYYQGGDCYHLGGSHSNSRGAECFHPGGLYPLSHGGGYFHLAGSHP